MYVGTLLEDAGISTDLTITPGQTVSVSGDPSLPQSHSQLRVLEWQPPQQMVGQRYSIDGHSRMLDFVCENEKFAEMRGTPVGIPPVFASSDRQTFSYSGPPEPSLCNRTLRLPRLVRLTGAKRLSVSCFGRPLKFRRNGAETALRAAPRGPPHPSGHVHGRSTPFPRRTAIFSRSARGFRV